MTIEAWSRRLYGRCQRTLSAALFRRPAPMRNQRPVISFTFDDFPSSSLETGGAILGAYGAAGTYYVSLGLLDRDEPVGRICGSRQLAEVLARGHELGCHTFRHSDAWATAPRAFAESVLENRRALARVLPGAAFETLSYPLCSPRPRTKRRIGRRFAACRGGGQRTNVGTLDLNNLRAFFLEQSSDRPAAIRQMIEFNRLARGWLIFVTHDVAPHPSPFGCTPALLEDVVRWSVGSGAAILPVARALDLVRGPSPCAATPATATRAPADAH